MTRLTEEIKALMSVRALHPHKIGVSYQPAHQIDVSGIGPEDMPARLYVNLHSTQLIFPGYSLYKSMKQNTRHYTR